jgi:Holliday junction DNA helicase RuvB
MPRPIARFRDFIGQADVIKPLIQQVHGAMTRAEPVLHTLLLGSSGVGKTLLARAIAEEIGVEFVEAMQEEYESKEKLTELLLRLKKCAVLFIDEVHRLPFPLQELLFKAIDQRRVPNYKRAGKDSSVANPSELEIAPITLVLATDRPEKLLNALTKRMPNEFTLRYYTVRELKEIVDKLAKDLNLLLTRQGARQIAKVSGGLPRIAKHHLQKLRHHFANSEKGALGLREVRSYLAKYHIDSLGLGTREFQYLKHLRAVQVASLESVALYLGLSPTYVRRQIETPLLRNCLITIGRVGRQLTPQGHEWLDERHTPDKRRSSTNENAQGG